MKCRETARETESERKRENSKGNLYIYPQEGINNNEKQIQ